jgi:muramoyltetrapeptide carboxypeptidase
MGVAHFYEDFTPTTFRTLGTARGYLYLPEGFSTPYNYTVAEGRLETFHLKSISFNQPHRMAEDSTRTVVAKRQFLKNLLALGTGLAFSPALLGANASVFPRHLKKKGTIGLVTPASAVADHSKVAAFVELLEARGFNVVIGQHVLGKNGYLAGTDQERADDIHRMFSDHRVDAIIAVRGGWGCARLLPLLDFDLIRNNPKILLGYSDLTALLLAIYQKTGLVTYHGPVGLSDWDKFTIRHFERTLMKARKYRLKGTKPDPSDLALGRTTITLGKASGILLGGNLAVLSGLVGSPYLPSFKGAILLLEEVGEEVYRIDRFLMHLKLAGILDEVSGVIFTSCSGCENAEKVPHSFSLQEILQQHLGPLGIPACFGMEVGHIAHQYTLPIGGRVTLDAGKGHLKLLDRPVA